MPANSPDLESPIIINGEPGGTLDPKDRGLAYGDGFFETLLYDQGALQNWRLHWQRMRKSANVLQIDLPNESTILNDITKLALNPQTPATVKIIITRGPGGRGYSPKNCHNSTVILSQSPVPNYSLAKQNGVELALLKTPLSEQHSLAGLKHLNRLNQVMARLELEQTDCFEGVLCNREGHVREVIASNIYLVSEGQVITPPLHDCGVEGTIRAKLLNRANNCKYPIKEQEFSVEQLLQADEVFISNSLMGICPVKQIAQQHFPLGEVSGYFSALTPEKD
ncbi:MAG: aminodeoxychorismate lyase [Alteromonadaceae bacterium]|nr:MAG: aminodeoxychorismate lyase [Alteromonadaceae bacterium]